MSRANKPQLVVLTGEPADSSAAGRPARGLGRSLPTWARPRFSRWLAVLLATTVSLGLVAGARAEELEALLFLGIQRSTTIDKLASQIIIEHLQERGESLQKGPPLSDTDRRCRRLQCLTPLAVQRKAALVLDGDVQQVGTNRTLRIIMHLYDAHKRQQHELENLCVDCDETKLGIMLTNTTTDLLGQYRKTVIAMDQLAALLDALPSTPNERGQAVPASPGNSPQGKVPAPGELPQPSVASTQGPTTLSPVQAAPRVPAAPTPAPYPSPPDAAGPPAGGPAAYPTPMPSLPAADPWLPSPKLAPKGLSTQRKAIAGVIGAIGAGSLVAAIVLNVLDHRIASNNSINASGSPCVDPQYAGQSCVYSTIRLWAPGYGVGALLLGGMILTLTVPEHEPR